MLNVPTYVKQYVVMAIMLLVRSVQERGDLLENDAHGVHQAFGLDRCGLVVVDSIFYRLQHPDHGLQPGVHWHPMFEDHRAGYYSLNLKLRTKFRHASSFVSTA